MIVFVLGVFAVWAIGVMAGYWWEWELVRRAGMGEAGPVAWIMLVFPALSAWAVAEAVNGVTPRRMFDRRIVNPWRCAASGFAAGVLGFAIAVAFLPMVERAMPDWVTLTAASGLATLMPAVLMKKVRRGRCVNCDYDLRALPSMERCPECGRTGVA